VKVELRVNEQTIPAVLEDTPTARAFLQLLPLELTLEDYSGTEKIADLPKRLTAEGGTESHRAKSG